MKFKDLNTIFGKDLIWDFYLNHNKTESLKFDAHNNFITSSGTRISISDIKVFPDSGIVRFTKHLNDNKIVQSTLVFIRDKSTLIGNEGDDLVKYIKTDKSSFD